MAEVKLLKAARLPQTEEQSWRSVEGLAHRIYGIHDSTLTTFCMLPRFRANRFGYVYGTRSSSYLPDELDDTNNQPITCLWCVAGIER